MALYDVELGETFRLIKQHKQPGEKLTAQLVTVQNFVCHPFTAFSSLSRVHSGSMSRFKHFVFKMNEPPWFPKLPSSSPASKQQTVPERAARRTSRRSEERHADRHIRDATRAHEHTYVPSQTDNARSSIRTCSPRKGLAESSRNQR